MPQRVIETADQIRVQNQNFETFRKTPKFRKLIISQIQAFQIFKIGQIWNRELKIVFR